MPPQSQIAIYFERLYRVSAVLGFVLMLVGGAFLYRFKSEFQEDLIKEIRLEFVTQIDAERSEARLATRESFENFIKKSNTTDVGHDTAINNLQAKQEIYQATIAGTLQQLQRDMAEVRNDVKDLIRGNHLTHGP